MKLILRDLKNNSLKGIFLCRLLFSSYVDFIIGYRAPKFGVIIKKIKKLSLNILLKC